MKKIVGYIVSVAGIGLMALGFGMVPVEVAILEGVAGDVLSGVGVGAVVVGALLSLKKGNGKTRKVKGGEDEVPIYEGVGKKRRVVGYRAD